MRNFFLQEIPLHSLFLSLNTMNGTFSTLSPDSTHFASTDYLSNQSCCFNVRKRTEFGLFHSTVKIFCEKNHHLPCLPHTTRCSLSLSLSFCRENSFLNVWVSKIHWVWGESFVCRRLAFDVIAVYTKCGTM